MPSPRPATGPAAPLPRSPHAPAGNPAPARPAPSSAPTAPVTRAAVAHPGPSALLGLAQATARFLADRIERTPLEALRDVSAGCEIARRAADIEHVYGHVWDVALLLTALRSMPRPALAATDELRAEAWDAGVELAIRGLEALAGHAGNVTPASPEGESEVRR